jgi:hypothetical protein
MQKRHHHLLLCFYNNHTKDTIFCHVPMTTMPLRRKKICKDLQCRFHDWMVCVCSQAVWNFQKNTLFEYMPPGLIQTFHILRELLCFDEVVVPVIVFLVRFCVAITNRSESSSSSSISSSSFCVQLPPVLFLFAHRADLIHLPSRSYTSSRK